MLDATATSHSRVSGCDAAPEHPRTVARGTDGGPDDRPPPPSKAITGRNHLCDRLPARLRGGKDTPCQSQQKVKRRRRGLDHLTAA